MKTISIIGAGSHSRSSINLIKDNFRGYNFNIYDDSFDIKKEEFIHEIKVIDTVENIDKNNSIFLSIGNNEIRACYFNKFNDKIIKENLSHKNTLIEKYINIGVSNQIFANVYINSYVSIGNNNIINTSAILEHEVIVGNNNHIAVGAKLCGRVIIGHNCIIGAGAIIIDKITICDNVVIGAGSVVTKNITERGTYVGVPARKIK